MAERFEIRPVGSEDSSAWAIDDHMQGNCCEQGTIKDFALAEKIVRFLNEDCKRVSHGR